MSEKPKYSFECLEQKCTTMDCHIRPHVYVTFGDLARWGTHNHLQQILPGLALVMPTNENEPLTIETARKPLEKNSEQTACIFYHEESNACSIRYARPISCRTFPLEYNGEKFFLSSKNCPGVGQGVIAKEVLQESRSLAEQEFKERIETFASLPVVYTMIYGQMMKQSTEAMQNLSEEDKKNLDEIMAKREQKTEPESEE
ncbi:MAG: YkgJ family cysteine cluster protein [Candidatus Thorarchaeota archaeon]